MHTNPHHHPRYRDTLATMFARSASSGIKLGLEPMQALLSAMGNPERRFKSVIVAGTNGKGSTSALIAAALQQAGHRVGLYTSPHLLRFTERIRVDGVEIAPERVVEVSEDVHGHQAVCPRPPTFFEWATALALQHFADEAVDVAVLEVGLGGRLDATNTGPRVLSVITPVALDHQAFLGDTLAAIAGEKAGIIAAHTPVVAAPQHPDAEAVIRARATQLGAPLLMADAPLVSNAVQPAFLRRNAAVAQRAAQALDALGIACPAEAFTSALSAFAWPGRYQWVDGAPPVLLDGAHNPAGCAALCESLAQDPRAQGRPIHAVFTAVHGKDAHAMLRLLRPSVASVHLCPVASGRARSMAQLRALAPDAQVHADAESALQAARGAAGADGLVLVAGSLFLVADALAILQPQPRDPPVDG